ncbi:MAG TPA: hypothetical protein DIU15_02345 [Deltaproteobacteria bacterium]|nr:hypothetical protein [Deltaproteobacteria bacterium]HCP44858.1 hypothetical protein [Deltaproteobacteria bacterium]
MSAVPATASSIDATATADLPIAAAGDGSGFSDGSGPPASRGQDRGGLPPDWEVLFGRLQWMMLIRILMVTVLFGLVLFMRLQDHTPIEPLQTVYPLFIAFYCLSILYAVVAKRMPNLNFFTYLQFAVDAACISLVLLFTGGAESAFTWLFVFNILGAGYLLLLQGGLIVASLDTVAYIVCLALSWSGVVPTLSPDGTIVSAPYELAPGEALRTYSTVAFHVASFFLLAFLSGSLAGKQAETGRALAETASSLYRLQDMHGRIVQNMDAGLLSVDRAGRITSFNRAAEIITRHQAMDVIGLAVTDIFRGADRLLEATLDRRAGPNPSPTLERWMTRKDRKRIYLRISASAMRAPDGTLDGHVLVFEDRTRLLLMEEQLEREERLAAVGRLSAGIAHEIRNPLASITGSVQVLRDALELHPEEAQLFGIVEREADRLGHLVTDFLTLTRDEKVELVPGRLGKLIQETLALLKGKSEILEGIQVTSELGFDPVVRFEDDRMRQVLWNLVNNACQVMSGSGGELRVHTQRVPVDDLVQGTGDTAFVGNLGSTGTVTEEGGIGAEAGDSALRIVVEDTGPGISDEALGRIFDPFYTTRSGGTGLGLAIVARIVQAHRGVITVHSRLGEGTRFSVWLPIDESPDGDVS